MRVIRQTFVRFHAANEKLALLLFKVNLKLVQLFHDRVVDESRFRQVKDDGPVWVDCQKLSAKSDPCAEDSRAFNANQRRCAVGFGDLNVRSK
jgi:hypothetical protein